jgi:2,4-dienoyl-CoA reductase-like NADH-dependent reductase (Old Yellow Enzyme family)
MTRKWSAAGVDLFDCSQRRFWDPAFAGDPRNLAGWVKRLTGKATMTVGSVGLDVDLIEMLNGSGEAACPPASLARVVEGLERGEYDLVGIGRALLADADWTAKVRRGALDTLVPFTRQALAQLV